MPAPGVDLNVCQRGETPSLLFLHGFAGDLHTWDGLWQALDETLPALRYDMRGYGESVARQNAAFSHADDLLYLLDALEIASVDLVGVSMGGGIAVNFAMDHPQRVRNLVLISPALVAWEWSEEWQSLWCPVAERARSGALSEARDLWWQHPLFASTRESKGAVPLQESIMRFSGTQWIRDYQRTALPDVERLHLLHTRTLLLTGGRDMQDFKLIADLLEVSAGSLQRIDRPDLGHLLYLEDANACADAIRCFLQAAPRPALS